MLLRITVNTVDLGSGKSTLEYTHHMHTTHARMHACAHTCTHKVSSCHQVVMLTHDQ